MLSFETVSQLKSLEFGQWLKPAGAPETPTAGTAFVELLKTSLESMNAEQVKGQESIQTLINGNGQNVHTVMLELEKANLGVELAVQVRNKILEAYTEIMHMQL